MKDSKRRIMKTTLGNLIAVLCEETRPYLDNDRDMSLVVSYILNNLMFGGRGSEREINRRAGAQETKNRGHNYENCLSRKGIDPY
jgi:hypothetical protein